MPFSVKLFAFAAISLASAVHAVELEVAAGSHARQATIVELVLPPDLQDAMALKLTRTEDGVAVPVQILKGEPPRAVWILGKPLAAWAVRHYRLAPAGKPLPGEEGVVVIDDGKRLVARVGEKPVLAYNHAVVPSPFPEAPYYARSGYLHPVFSPSGKVVTGDFSADHAHQHGIMFAWRKVTFDGRESNGWEQKQKTGRVEHVRIEAVEGGPVVGCFAVAMRQLDLTAPGGPAPVLNETWQVSVANREEGFLFDMLATQTCATDRPVRVDEIHYGGMAFRGSDDWLDPKVCHFLTSEGKTRSNGNHTRPRWVSAQGPLDGKTCGITVFCHPENFRFPQPVRLHPKMPYFCFTPATAGTFTIEPGTPYVSRFRFHVHDGPVDLEETERLWADWTSPPTVRILDASER